MEEKFHTLKLKVGCEAVFNLIQLKRFFASGHFVILIFQIAELTGQRDDAEVQLPTLKVNIMHTEVLSSISSVPSYIYLIRSFCHFL